MDYLLPMSKVDRQLFASARSARLATFGNGKPHLVPVVFALSDGLVYTAVDHKPKTTPHLRRLRNISENPHVSLLVDHYDEDWSLLWWIRVDGTAKAWPPESTDGRNGIDALVDKYPQYQRVRPTGPVIAVDPDNWTGWSAVGP